MFRHPSRTAFLFCLVAFVARLAAVVISPGHFWAYTVYYEMAQTLVAGGGYCMSPGILCAYFPPVYPTALAAGIMTGYPFAGIATLGALAGAGTVWFVWLTAGRWFGTRAGLAAAAYAAVYPYFVWHDAVVQETGVLTLVVTAAVWLLVRGDKWIISGCLLGLAVLTKANVSLFAVGGLVWIALWSPGTRSWRMRRLVWTAAGVALLVGPWVVRTWLVTGSPAIYSNGGFALWTAQHPLTFDYFPKLSIDEASIREQRDLPAEGRQACDTATDPQGVGCSVWYWNEGMRYMKAAPGTALKHGVQKVWVGFSPVFSPEKPGLFQWVYFASYGPVLVLAWVGAWRGRRHWRELGFVGVLALTFAAGCAVFWGHTSHRMYLEPCLMILASSVFSDASTSEPGAGSG